MDAQRRTAGMSLIEVVMAIAVLGVALPPVASLYREVAQQSVDHGLQDAAQQAADALMEEIASKAYADPEGLSESFGAEEAGRSSFDDVDDYDGLVEAPPRLLDGTTLPAYASLTRSVAVDNVTSSDPDAATPAADGSTDLKRIRVTVGWRHGRGGDLTLTTLRANPTLDGGGLTDLIDGPLSATTAMPLAWEIFELYLVSVHDEDLELVRMELSDSIACTNLMQLSLGGNLVWNTETPFPTSVITLTGSASQRTIKAMKYPPLRVTLKAKPIAGKHDFTFVLFFSDGTSDSATASFTVPS